MIDDPVADYTAFTCTNFMIKLKLRLKELRDGETFRIYSTREQLQNLPKKFFKPPLHLATDPVEPNKYLLTIGRDR